MQITKLAVALPAVGLLLASVPTHAEARTKSIVKWGAIGLGAAALANYANQPRYNYNYYPSYSYGYSHYPSYSYGYNYYPSYNYGYGGGYYGGYYGY